ncbi:cofactor-independent phosphoglycerate mutase [Sporanaerobium hydrogeniformans]|uniref:Cofactor-independent phosphoglycerate mutase n=1 Tax=Sporanaerobium hydrogeniformans TaxID=3072179 RepID=A0AC61DG45_9FIRM|nr:cofactor-independent phosphoglycerate mutase [Sporanaerobium hydrogeniformans]PHV72018.1 cofactor-independent phosphoglycerate mutase [Sporanaerobium hydrogeniformans]
MKYVVILMDGMADEPIEALGGITPLEYANTETIDALAPYSHIGMVHTIPEGCAKGSDTANLSVLGYHPKKYYFGRSPLEALSMGITLKDTDITFRTNVVTLSEEEDYEQKRILDHSADEITTEEAKELIEAVQEAFGDKEKTFYPGVSYRHLLVWDKGSKAVNLTPPHDILEKCIAEYKPQGDYSEEIWEMMKKSYEILNHHPINEKRREKGLKPANSIWIWGEGSKPQLPDFKEKYQVEGAVISAVDLIKGIGIGAGMTSIDVEGATGNVHTNYDGKAQAAIKWLIDEDKDFVYVHLEGPDECGHRNELENKIKAIELIDSKVIKPIQAALDAKNLEYKLLVVPDHPTPLRLRTHTDDPVPYMIYESGASLINKANCYTERFAKATGKMLEEGYTLMDLFLK